MSNTPQLFVQRTLGAASELVYSVPAATSVVINYISLCNPSSVTHTVTIGIGDNAATKNWRKDLVIGASQTEEWAGAFTLEPADIIAMDADVTSAIDLIICGLKVI